jgi:hypothetical protein
MTVANRIGISCTAALLLAVVAFVGLILFVGHLFGGCFEHVKEQRPSPDGAYVALSVYEGCGGAAGSARWFIRLRPADAAPDARADTVVSTNSGYVKLQFSWEDARTLAVTYQLNPQYDRVTVRSRWKDVRIVNRSAS